MKRICFFFLDRMFGKKRYYRFFLILKNIGMQGLNYRNTNIKTNGELFLIQRIAQYYKALNKAICVFDVGANIGNYSKILTDQFQDLAVIFAFEPFSVPFYQLKIIAENNPSIKPFRLGMSDKNEELIIHSSDEFSEIGGIYNRNFIFHDIPHDKQELNQFVTIDSFCQENRISQIHFLKIDVEGHEFSVLKGATNLFDQNGIDFIQFEFGAGNHFSRTYFMDFYNLLSKKYVFFRLLSDGLIEVENYNSELETQNLTNFVAIHKSHCNDFLNTLA